MTVKQDIAAVVFLLTVLLLMAGSGQAQAPRVLPRLSTLVVFDGLSNEPA